MAKIVLAIIILVAAIGVYHFYGGNDLESSYKEISDAIQWHVLPRLYITYSWLESLVIGPAENKSTINMNFNMFTKEELQKLKYTHLAIVGEVYDVSKGQKHYGKDGHYNFFTGRDGSRAYATGEFTDEGLKEDISGLKASDAEAIESFRSMYAKEYSYAGRLVGHYYTADGEETENKLRFKKMLGEAEVNKQAEQEYNKLYPPCNSEFTGQVSRVWCSNKSGGINREWAGVPRRLYKPGSDGFRCACIKSTGPPSTDPNSQTHSNRGDLDNPNLGEYKGCEPRAKSCSIIPPKK